MSDAIARELIRNRLLKRAGLWEPEPAPYQHLTFEDIRRQECSDSVSDMMDNRLVMGFLRYGPIANSKPLFYDLTKAYERLDAYERDGNTEHLIDAMNFCRLEFRRGCHPKKHFHACDR
jgi:hypothetical protein